MLKTRKASGKPSNELPKIAVLSKTTSKGKEVSKPASGENTAEKRNSAGNRSLKSAKIFRYEIDCGQVKDSIDVNKLVRIISNLGIDIF